jgi:hypothetical protein
MFILLDLISASFPGDECCVRWSNRHMCCKDTAGVCCENNGFGTNRGFPNRHRNNVSRFVHSVKLFNKILIYSMRNQQIKTSK